MVALVGPSGGGKSTIVNLIEHFYEISQGEIIVGEVLWAWSRGCGSMGVANGRSSRWYGYSCRGPVLVP